MILQVLCLKALVCICVVLILQNTIASAETAWHITELQVATETKGVRLTSSQISFGENHVKHVNYYCPDTLSIYPLHQCKNAITEFEFNNTRYEVLVDSIFDAINNHWSVQLMTSNEQLSLLLDSKKDDAVLELMDFQLENSFYDLPSSVQSLSGLISGVVLADIKNLTIKSTDPLRFNQISYEYSDDFIVAGLAGELVMNYDFIHQKITLSLDLTAGEMLLNELYVNFASYPVQLAVDVTTKDGSQFVVDAKLINKQSLDLNAIIEVDKGLNWNLSLANLAVVDSHHFNQNILSSVLGIYGFGKTEMSGGFNIHMQSAEKPLQKWQVNFNDFYALNTNRKVQIDAMDGTFNWDRIGKAADSKISWQSLILAGLPVDEAEMVFNFSNDQFNLLGPHEFLVLDGSIQMNQFSIDALFSESVDMGLNAKVLPISLKQITEKLGWPVMSGFISGDIPGMIKKGQVIEFLGALKLSVFEGDMLIENLSLERLFGVAPVFAADVSFNHFNLSLLTETFGFGQITGRLSGEINELRITNWKTDRLDAQVYTVKTKGVKQTISQRAIDNISSLGGIKGAISKTFLRFFDDFRYKKIKLSCKLHNSVCQIGGITNQNNQFVIVEGGGIPKINIVGFVRTINWEEFISRLLNANYDN